MEIIASFNERLKEAVSESRLSQSEISRLSKVPRTSLNKYLAGVSKAGNVYLYSLAQVLNVDVLWLMGYDVPKRESDEHRQLRRAVDEKLTHLSTENLSKVKRFIEEFLEN